MAARRLALPSLHPAKYMAKQPPAETKRQLQSQLDRFATYFNEIRPHRSLDRRRPLEVFASREKATPTGPRIDTTGYRIRGTRSTRPVW